MILIINEDDLLYRCRMYNDVEYYYVHTILLNVLLNLLLIIVRLDDQCSLLWNIFKEQYHSIWSVTKSCMFVSQIVNV